MQTSSREICQMKNEIEIRDALLVVEAALQHIPKGMSSEEAVFWHLPSSVTRAAFLWVLEEKHRIDAAGKAYFDQLEKIMEEAK